MIRIFAFAFDVDVLGAVHHDFGDGLVRQQRFQRAETEYFRDDGLEESFLFRARQGDAFFGQDVLEQVFNRPADFRGPVDVHGGVQLAEQLVLHPGFQVEICVAGSRLRGGLTGRTAGTQFGKTRCAEVLLLRRVGLSLFDPF
jgi:hypothetical protein